MATEYRTGDALFAFDRDLTVVSWNKAAEELTGIAAEKAVGRPCWELLRAVDARGDLVCHPRCSGARLAGEGWPVKAQRLLIKVSSGGRRAVWLSTIAVREGDEELTFHLLRNGPEVEAEGGNQVDLRRLPRLTERQAEVLDLVSEGLSAKAIARRLKVAEPTVRNHIRALLREFGCHSQLEMLAAARRYGLTS